MTEAYSARQLQVLDGLEAVRKRPGMYIGSTDQRGLMHCIWEIIDNSVDEALAGNGTEISVVLNQDGSITVVDHGRGVPVDIEPKTGLSGVEVVFTKLHAGGKFGSSSYGATGGLHGVGASVVNALSSRLEVEVDRDGATWAMSFRRGEPGTFKASKDAASPKDEFSPSTGNDTLRKVAKVAKRKTGTRITFWPDHAIFTKNAQIDWELLQARARQTAFLVPGLKFVLRDDRADQAQLAEFKFDGGISEFVDYLAHDQAVTDVWRFQGQTGYSEVVPVLHSDGSMVDAEVERECTVDIALRWGAGYETTERSFVNIISTPHGGSHVQGFEQALVKAVRKAVQTNARKLKAGTDKLEKDDVLAGLTTVITVRLPEPQFEGQTKETLGTPAIRGIVADVVASGMKAKFASTRRDDKTEVNHLLTKIVSEMKSRISARQHKEAQRRKNALENSTLPAKLADCRTHDIDSSELFIVEGDSALGTAKLARNSEFQALLPIRGKILNVQKATAAEILNNAECANIIQVIGAGSGRSFDIDQARYGKIIMMSDADVDGAHIRTLLLTLMYRFMRPMVAAGRVYAAVPPLHRIEVSARGKKPKEIIYTYSDNELHTALQKLDKQGRSYRPPQRYKGLGEMDADQLAETTMDPQHRLLRRVMLPEIERTENVFEVLMGSEVAPRKDFIVRASEHIGADRIDA